MVGPDGSRLLTFVPSTGQFRPDILDMTVALRAKRYERAEGAMGEIHDERPDRWLALESPSSGGSWGCRIESVGTPPDPSLLCRQLSGLAALVRLGTLCCSPPGRVSLSPLPYTARHRPVPHRRSEGGTSN